MSEALSGRTEHIVRALITRASERTELVLSAGRFVVCSFVLLRLVWFGVVEPAGFVEKSSVAIPALLVAIGISVWIARRAFLQRLSPGLLLLSVLLDAGTCFAALLPDVLHPWPTYPGLLRLPDVAIIPLLVVATGLRLSLSTAVIGSVLNLLSLAVLVTLDQALNRSPYGVEDISLFGLYLAASCVIGLVIVTRTTFIARRAAENSVKAELAQRSLSLVMQDHHDVRSLLSSAQINTDLMLRELVGQADTPLGEAARTLKNDLAEVTRFITGSRERAYVELSALADLEPVNAFGVAEGAAVFVERFPGVVIEITRPEPDVWVRVVGGERGLERVLVNLFVNACEGNGTRGARRIEVELGPDSPDFVRLVVSDDGPGFAPNLLTTAAERFATTKPGSSGIGLYLVRSVIEASGGEVLLSNEPGRGAQITLKLPAVAAPKPEPVEPQAP